MCSMCNIYIYVFVYFVNVLLLRLQPATAQTKPLRQPQEAFSQCCPAQGFQPVLRSARLSARAEPWRRSQSVPGAFYQCTEDAGVLNEYVKHGVMAE